MLYASDNQFDLLMIDIIVARNFPGLSLRCVQHFDALVDALRRGFPSNLPRVIVIDLNLPGAADYSEPNQIRNLPGCGDIPIIFLGDAQPDFVEERMSPSGCTVYLRKSMDVQNLEAEFVGKIRELLSAP